MKKKLILFAALICTSFVFAYNPPLGGESLFRLTNPELLGGAASASGGPLLTVIPSSITYNPALSVLEQRVDVDLSFSAMFNTNRKSETDGVFGSAFQAGTIIPTKWFVYSADVQGIFANFDSMNLRNSIIIHGGIAKEINEKLAVGMNLYSGYYLGSDSDFTVGADLGMFYQFEDFKFTKKEGSFFNKSGFLSKARLGIAFLNLGKPLFGYGTKGIYADQASSNYPGILTPRISFASNLINPLTKKLDENGNALRSKFNSGISMDISAPTFQNLIFDCAIGFSYDNIVNLNISWEANLREILTQQSQAISWPSVSLSFRFAFNSSKFTGNNEDLAKSEIIPVLAWQNLYNGIQVISGAAKLNLGMADEQPPEIILWDEE